MSARSDGTDPGPIPHGGSLPVVTVALALLVRLPDLVGWWPNPDEGIYYGVVTRSSWSGAWTEALTTSHPPLYFLILRTVGLISTDFAALRSVALVSGCAAVWVFILLGRELGGPGRRGEVTGLLAGLLLAVSPRAIVLSQVMRPYMLLVLVLAASLLFLLRYLRRPSRGLLAAHLACSLAATVLHYSSVFGLAVIGILALVEAVRRGLGKPEWQRMLAAQAVPAAVLLTLYFVHLRGIAEGPLGEHALEGWLAPYMIYRPTDVWLGLVAFHSMLVGDAWAAPATLFTLGALAYAASRRTGSLLVLMTGAGLLLGIVGAALEIYPFGPTRHTAWLLVFVIPTVAWALAALVTAPRPLRLRAGTAVVAGLVGAKLLGPVLDPESRPREISEHVLTEAGVEAMAQVLDPSAPPRMVVMSQETYELLTPLYSVERESARTSPDGRYLTFRWGSRDVIVLPSRDFVAKADEIRQANHLHTGSLVAAAALGIRPPDGGNDGTVLVLSGGWRSQGLVDLVELARRVGPLGTTTSVPGLVGLYLDFGAYWRALGLPPS